jgi:acetoacetyl-CoA synthetase
MTALWTPSPAQIEQTNLSRFMRYVDERLGESCADYATLHRWSVQAPAAFWRAVWDFTGVVASDPGEEVLAAPDAMPGARFFPGARLNFAENLLRRRDDSDALVFRDEPGTLTRLSRRELCEAVARCAAHLKAVGVGPGDRVAAVLPNVPETVIAALATASIGAVWSSCSPDFGVKGVLDRFAQIEPRVLISCDGYLYNGKVIEVAAKVGEIAARLGPVQVFLVPFLARRGAGGDRALATVRQSSAGEVKDWDDLMASPQAVPPLEFARLPFDHPLYVMFSSGTTGLPKCIVHGAGGTLLQHLKEHQLHVDVRAGDRVFWFTTCGWMMWNWLVSALASDATVLLYDGSPFHPGPEALFDFADDTGMTHFGTSAKYIQAIEKEGLRPIDSHSLAPLRVMGSTGSTLLPEGFDYVYGAVKRDLQLASVSGGTDILSCFVLGNPNLPVHRGEIQCAGLGMAVAVWDEAGKPVVEQKGELVCTRPFPSMPIGFWNDPAGERYHQAYFATFPGVWAHGDFAEQTAHGGFLIHGRSDATLNPGGVRIGTAEIYRQVEQSDAVLESVAIGQEWEGDVRVVLFVRLRDGVLLDDALVADLKQRIRTGASPRHVPARIVAVEAIPRTRSGKITELAIRDVVHGREVRNVEALANPEALAHFRDRPELAG